MDQATVPVQLSAADSLLWRIESDPVLRTPILVVGLLDRSPTARGVEDTIERAATVLPRLRQRLEAPPLGFGRPRWVDADEPSLAAHLRRVRAPGGDIDAVLDLAAADAAAAFDPARPPWTLTIVDGLDRGRAAVVLRFHHAITDGVGGIELAEQIFDRSRRPRAGAAHPAASASPPPPPPAPGGWAPAARAAARLVGDLLTHPDRQVRAAGRLARSVTRTLAPSRGDGSPALVGRSLDRWLSVTERPLDALRRAADTAGGTVNDVLLAAVAGALDAYHRRQHEPVRTVRVTMPISVRCPDDPPGGNRFVPARFTLPVDDPDPRARVLVARALVRRWRAEPALASSNAVAAALDLLPPALATRLFAGMLRSMDVDIVDVPGLDRRAYLGRARLERLWAFAPPTGAALSVTLVSHQATACIGLACDRLPVADPELLATCLGAALDEVIALGDPREGGPAAPVRRSA